MFDYKNSYNSCSVWEDGDLRFWKGSYFLRSVRCVWVTLLVLVEDINSYISGWLVRLLCNLTSSCGCIVGLVILFWLLIWSATDSWNSLIWSIRLLLSIGLPPRSSGTDSLTRSFTILTVRSLRLGRILWRWMNILITSGCGVGIGLHRCSCDTRLLCVGRYYSAWFGEEVVVERVVVCWECGIGCSV